MLKAKWEPGRQAGCVYRKARLWQIGSALLNKWSDCYIIEYPPNAILPMHTDPVKKGRHYRLNIELKGKGEFKCTKPIFKKWRVALFRPDVSFHGMENGPTIRRVLSLGFVV